MTEEHVFQCTGCESECDVVVRVQNGKIVAVEGNDCPTGASYAISQYKMKNNIKTHSAITSPSDNPHRQPSSINWRHID